MYEHRKHRPIGRSAFVGRVLGHAAIALGVALFSLVVGMAGYMRFEGLAWRDAFLNASMLLGGMGPVDPPRTPDGKLFAGVYALYAGLVFLLAIAIILAPVLHRVLHTFHADDQP